MMSEYVRPEEAQSVVDSDQNKKSSGKRKGSWRFNNNILDLEAIEKSSKAYSSKDASEMQKSPTMSPTFHAAKKGKKSRFAPTIPFGKQKSQGDIFKNNPVLDKSPKIASPFSKMANQSNLISKQ